MSAEIRDPWQTAAGIVEGYLDPSRPVHFFLQYEADTLGYQISLAVPGINTCDRPHPFLRGVNAADVSSNKERFSGLADRGWVTVHDVLERVTSEIEEAAGGKEALGGITEDIEKYLERVRREFPEGILVPRPPTDFRDIDGLPITYLDARPILDEAEVRHTVHTFINTPTSDIVMKAVLISYGGLTDGKRQSVTEIATALGISEDQVEVQLTKGLEICKSLLSRFTPPYDGSIADELVDAFELEPGIVIDSLVTNLGKNGFESPELLLTLPSAHLREQLGDERFVEFERTCQAALAELEQLRNPPPLWEI